MLRPVDSFFPEGIHDTRARTARMPRRALAFCGKVDSRRSVPLLSGEDGPSPIESFVDRIIRVRRPSDSPVLSLFRRDFEI